MGRPQARAVEWHQRLRELADELLTFIQPGVTCDEVFSFARKKAARLDLIDALLRFPSGSAAHFVGHGLGLELNEPPLLARGRPERLQAGMVLALELHIMTVDGITLKLEDTFHLAENGYRILTESPRDLTVL